MKITDGEIRGTIALAAILLVIMGAVWIFSPASCNRSGSTAPVYFPEDSIELAGSSSPNDADAHNNATGRKHRTAKSDTASVRDRRSGNTRQSKSRSRNRKSAPHRPDRPSPLDSPVED